METFEDKFQGGGGHGRGIFLNDLVGPFLEGWEGFDLIQILLGGHILRNPDLTCFVKILQELVKAIVGEVGSEDLSNCLPDDIDENFTFLSFFQMTGSWSPFS